MAKGVYLRERGWSPSDERALRRFASAGLTDKQIVAELDHRFSEGSVRNKRSRMGLVDQARSDISREVKDRIVREARAHLSAQAASIWHLIDLKRAGHSPTRTELKISPEGVGQRFAPEPLLTYRSPFAEIVEG